MTWFLMSLRCIPSVQALMGVLGYTMQIYCDFSGYSDMAIGLALLMGFHLGINFDSPIRAGISRSSGGGGIYRYHHG